MTHTFKNYLVTWTDIYNLQHVNHTQSQNEEWAKIEIPSGDVLKRIDKVEEAIYDNNLKKWVPKPPPYPHSKFPILDADDYNFWEYSSEYVPNQGEIPDFETAHAIATSLLPIKPNTILAQGKDGKWWVGTYYSKREKKAYFQGGGGVNEPTPGQKKYKSDKAIVVQPRFKEPFYRNYDSYDISPTNQSSKLGPGAGWHELQNYKSVSDFLKDKRKRLKDKYKADDKWIEDEKSSERATKRRQKIKARACLLFKLNKYAIDFPIDDMVTPILGDEGTYSDIVPIGGTLDEYLPLNDFEGKSPDKLDFGRDYVENELDGPKSDNELNPSESFIYGLPDGIFPIEDLDQISPEDLWYGTTDSGNTFYNEMWI